VYQPVIVGPKLPWNPTPLLHSRKEVTLQWVYCEGGCGQVTASLVPKVDQEKGVPYVCCICTYLMFVIVGLQRKYFNDKNFLIYSTFQCASPHFVLCIWSLLFSYTLHLLKQVAVVGVNVHMPHGQHAGEQFQSSSKALRNASKNSQMAQTAFWKHTQYLYPTLLTIMWTTYDIQCLHIYACSCKLNAQHAACPLSGIRKRLLVGG